MVEILKNTLLFALWVLLSAALVYGIFLAGEDGAISGGTAVMMWLIGQLVILTPLIRILWVNRKQGTPDA